MPHFTVVPVQDNSPSNYDSLEGINWVDYRDTGQGGYPGHGDTVSSDGTFFFYLSLRQLFCYFRSFQILESFPDI